MKTISSALFLAVAAAATMSCGGKSGPAQNPPTNNAAAKVEVSIASVTLADDCGTGPTAEPTVEVTQDQAPQAGARLAGDMAAGSMAKRACEQSSIQLRVANGTAEAGKVGIQKVEVLDESGALVAELTPRAPSQWADDSYQAWDEQVAPNGVLQVSYALSAPNVMRGATYTVRVTVDAGDGAQTLEQRTTLEAEASLPPGVVT